MRNAYAIRRLRPVCTLGSAAFLGAVLGGELAAGAPPPRDFVPGRPVPPRGRFFGPPAIPSPIPAPYWFPVPEGNPNLAPLLPVVPGLGVTGPTDRCLVNPPSIDPGSIKTAASIDPGIFAEPRVQGLPIRTSGWRPR